MIGSTAVPDHAVDAGKVYDPNLSDEVNTLRVIAAMTVESTGTHMLDSGMSTGRAWQRARLEAGAKGINLDDADQLVHAIFGEVDQWGRWSSPAAAWGYSCEYVNVSASHVLSMLKYDHRIDRVFHDWATRGDQADEAWLETMTRWAEKMGAGEDRNGSGVESVNTYNYETNLDTTLQWVTYLAGNGDRVLLIQRHNGADVRGGYTAPRAFTIDEHDDEGYWRFLDAGTSYGVYCAGDDDSPVPASPIYDRDELTGENHGWEARGGDMIDRDGYSTTRGTDIEVTSTSDGYELTYGWGKGRTERIYSFAGDAIRDAMATIRESGEAAWVLDSTGVFGGEEGTIVPRCAYCGSRLEVDANLDY